MYKGGGGGGGYVCVHACRSWTGGVCGATPTGTGGEVWAGVGVGVGVGGWGWGWGLGLGLGLGLGVGVGWMGSGELLFEGGNVMQPSAEDLEQQLIGRVVVGVQQVRRRGIRPRQRELEGRAVPAPAVVRDVAHLDLRPRDADPEEVRPKPRGHERPVLRVVREPLGLGARAPGAPLDAEVALARPRVVAERDGELRMSADVCAAGGRRGGH